MQSVLELIVLNALEECLHHHRQAYSLSHNLIYMHGSHNTYFITEDSVEKTIETMLIRRRSICGLIINGAH